MLKTEGTPVNAAKPATQRTPAISVENPDSDLVESALICWIQIGIGIQGI
jgi:hypothetical protein